MKSGKQIFNKIEKSAKHMVGRAKEVLEETGELIGEKYADVRGKIDDASHKTKTPNKQKSLNTKRSSH